MAWLEISCLAYDLSKRCCCDTTLVEACVLSTALSVHVSCTSTNRWVYCDNKAGRRTSNACCRIAFVQGVDSVEGVEGILYQVGLAAVDTLSSGRLHMRACWRSSSLSCSCCPSLLAPVDTYVCAVQQQ
jgi:hypothetical protein